MVCALEKQSCPSPLQPAKTLVRLGATSFLGLLGEGMCDGEVGDRGGGDWPAQRKR